ncbi:MAG: type II toxin-antitoxin system HicB family antitoxin [Nitrosopumilaceae archaeon]|nr:type II toxin-antitoxin system HicB family antitoxin [Nitrosopumilaceae archaeon]
MSTTVQKKTYSVVITKDLEEGGFVGTCDELHAVSEGDTFGEMMGNIREAMELAAEEGGSATDFNMLVTEQ